MRMLLLTFLLPQAEAPVRIPVRADTVLSLSDGEERDNGGARSTLRLKGIEDIPLFDFDLAPLKGRRVDEARFFFHPLEGHRLKTLGISTVSTPWQEGRGNGKAAQRGEPCFLEAARDERPWGDPGSDFHAVSFGAGGSVWFSRDLRPEADGTVSVEVPPAVLHAMLEGNSFGFALTDDKSQTHHNNSLYSREQNAKAPYLLVLKSQPGPAPPSGAKRFVPTPPSKPAPAFTPKVEPPKAVAPATLADGCRWRVLYEGATDPAAPPAARLWDGRALHLAAARGEHVAFQIAVEVPAGESRPIRIEGEGWTASRAREVGSSVDPLIPIAGEVSGKALFHVERLVPKDARPGTASFPLALRTGKAEAAIPVSVRIHPATLPDVLGFQVSLNSYSSMGGLLRDRAGSPAYLDLERSAFRLAHEHRATLCIVPYSHRGSLDFGMAPETKRSGAKIEVVSWKTYDDHWGPYLDGSAFKGLPRDGVPLGHFYWPHHEQWPLPINEFYSYKGKPDDHWRDAPAPEQAFAPEYGKAFADVLRAFASHARERGWTRTQFQVFLNNKPDIRFVRRENEGAWWRLDEPVSAEDHLAIRYFAARCKDVSRAFKDLPVVFRADLSRPQWRRNYLDGMLDLDVVAGSYRRYPDFVFGRGEEVWIYGGVPAPGANGESGRAWALQSFLDGADGLVPWLTTGTDAAWDKPTDTALLLPPRAGMERRVHATLRLKGLRRAQQDIELLRLLLAKKKLSRAELRPGLAEALGLRASFVKTSEEDAGRMDYRDLDPDRFEAVRRAVLAELDTP
jgi:hypothetical protein